MLCDIGGVLLGTAGGAGTDTITLSGTSGSPNARTASELSIDDAYMEWSFETDGTVDINRSDTGNSQFQAGVEWNASQPTPTATYYIKATLDSGTIPTSGSTMTTWLALSSRRWWRWTETRNGFYTTTGTLKIEIATDSGGTNIVATGYYRGTAAVEL